MSSLYHTFFFDPLYNLFVALSNTLPWADVGIIVVMLTVLVRFALYPLSKKAIETQIKMNEIAPEIEKLKQKHKNDGEAQAKATLALYREKNINPFSSIFMILVQLPIIFALYRIFLHLSEVRTDILYSFVSAPGSIDLLFLGFLDISGKSAVIALLAAISTYFQLSISTKTLPVPQGDGLGESLSRNMQTQMKYFFPVLVFFISYQISAVIALYWLTTNLFTIGQEIIVRRRPRLA